MHFTQHQETEDWCTDVDIQGTPVHLVIDKVHPSSAHERLAVSSMTRVSESQGVMRDNLLRSLHSLYNDTWADPDQGFPAMEEGEFLKRITLKEIKVLDEEGALSLFFEDGDLFGGHMIEIFWPSEGKMYAATLVG
jgi:hypothetical protein